MIVTAYRRPDVALAARKKALVAVIWTTLRFSGTDFGCGTDLRPDLAGEIGSETQIAAENIVRIPALSASFRAQIRLTESRAGHGWSPSSISCRAIRLSYFPWETLPPYPETMSNHPLIASAPAAVCRRRIVPNRFSQRLTTPTWLERGRCCLCVPQYRGASCIEAMLLRD